MKSKILHNPRLWLIACLLLSYLPTKAQLTYCAAANTDPNAAGSLISSVTFGSISNVTGSTYPTNGYSYWPAQTTSVILGTTQTLTLTIDPPSSYSGAIVSVWVDWNQDGTLSASEWLQVGTNLTNANNPHTLSIPIPATATLGTTRMRIRSRGSGNVNGSGDACTSMGSGETEDYDITVIAPTACSGTPTAGTANGPTSTLCPFSAFTVSLTGSTLASGITYQWQSRPTAGGSWADISGATNFSYSPSGGIGVNTDYRAYVTCTSASASDTSNSVSISVSTPFPGGTYTIDPTQAASATNFQSFSAAVSAISCGISGNVVFNVPATTTAFNEQVTLPATINANGSRTVTFNCNGDTLKWAGTSAAPWTLGLNGADNITFNNLVVKGTDATYALVAHLWNQADSNTFNNCVFLAPANGTSTIQVPFSVSGSATSATTSGSSGNGNIVSGCTIFSGYYNTVFYGNSAAASTGNQVLNCNLEDFYFYGSYNAYQNGIMISGNTVERPTRSTVSTFYGIYLTTGCSNALVEKNKVRNMFGGSPNYAGAIYSIYCLAASTAGNENKIYNNVIGNFNGNTTTAGLYLSGGTYVQAYNNTISIDNGSATTGTVYGIYATGTAGVDIKDNNVSITQAGSGTKYCLYFSGAGKTSNYNNLFMGSAAGTRYIGYYSSGFATLAAWQGANSNAWDQNSVSVDPAFASPSTFNFSPTNGGLDDLGTPLASVTTDILGNSRSATTPDIGAYEFSVPPCGGTPVAGTASAPDSVCSGNNFSLSLSGYTIGSGITIQWEESPAGAGVWSTITNATSSNYIVSGGITTPMDYHAIITCSNGGATDISNTVSVDLNPFYACYCTSAATSTADEEILNVSFGSLNNSSTCATVAPGPGSVQSMYSNYTTLTPPTVTQGTTVPLSVQVGTCGGNYGNWTKVYIDFNQNGSYADPGEEVLSSATAVTGPHIEAGTVTIPMTASVGTTGMRVVTVETTSSSSVNPCGTYSWGETEDYSIDIAAAVSCNGTPSAGNAYAPDSVCANATFTLSDTASTTGIGITYQWESSPAGAGVWSAILGATNQFYTLTGGITSATDFHLVVTCTNGGAIDVSNVVSVALNAFYDCYCASSSVYTGDEDILNVTFGSMINSSTCATVAPGPGSVQNLYSNYTSVTPATVIQGTLVPFSIQIGTCGSNYGNWTKMYIDLNQNGDYTDPGEEVYSSLTSASGPHTESGTISIPVTAAVGITGLRVVNVETTAGSGVNPCGTYSYGETEDYYINIGAAVACAGTPSAGTAYGPDSMCASVPFTLMDTAYTNALGITYQWEESPYGAGVWSAILGATTPNYVMSAGITAPTDYRLVVTCSNGGGQDISNLISVAGIYPASQCYCTPTGASATYSINNFSTTGGTININNLNSGLSAGGYGNFTGMMLNTVPGTTVNFSASFAPSGYTYGFALWIDWAGDGSFAQPGDLVYNTTGYTSTVAGSFLVPLTATMGNTRMRITANYLNGNPSSEYCSATNGGTYSEWEDYTVSIGPPPSCPTPTSLIVSNATTSSVDVNWTENGSATNWQIEYGPSGFTQGTGTLTGNITAKPYTLSLVPGGAYDVYVRSICGPNDTSTWSTSEVAATVPTNDSCAFAIDITNGQTYNGYTSVATQSMPACDLTPVANDVWYSFTTGSISGSVTVSATSTIADLVLQVFSGTCSGTLTAMTPTASSAPTLQPCIDGPAAGTEYGTFTVAPFTTYLVRVYGYNGSQGTFGINALGAPLAIKLSKIDATNLGAKNRVDWSTESELKSDKFELERSADGRNFSYLAGIAAKGEASTYSYVDEKPVTGINYYRLKMIDAAGVVTTSKVVTATVKQGAFTVEAYPNPVSEKLTIEVYGGSDQNATVAITDVTGKVMKVVNVVNGKAEVNMNGLASGVYLVKYTDNNHSQTIKVNKQ